MSGNECNLEQLSENHGINTDMLVTYWHQNHNQNQLYCQVWLHIQGVCLGDSCFQYTDRYEYKYIDNKKHRDNKKNRDRKTSKVCAHTYTHTYIHTYMMQICFLLCTKIQICCDMKPWWHCSCFNVEQRKYLLANIGLCCHPSLPPDRTLQCLH